MLTYTIYWLGWQIVDATPPMEHHGLTTVCPPDTELPASNAQSYLNLHKIILIIVEKQQYSLFGTMIKL